MTNGVVLGSGVPIWADGATGHIDWMEYPQSRGTVQLYTASYVLSPVCYIIVRESLSDGWSEPTVITPDYFVDSAAAGGGDGSFLTPYNTLAGLPTLVSGDVVAIKSDSIFLESFDFSDNVDVKIFRYGTGAKPILDARDSITAGSWTPSGAGLGNTYQASITWDGSATGISVEHVGAWEDDARAVLGGSATTLALGEYYIADHTTGSGTIYFRALDDGDLSAGSSVIKQAKRHGGVDTTQTGTGALIDGCTFDGIQTIGNTNNNGSLVAGADTIIRHCEPSEGTKHNLYYQHDSKLYAVLAKNFYNGAAALTAFVYNENTPAGEDVIHDGCAGIQESGYVDATVSATAFHGHINTSGNYGTVSYTQCMTNGIGVKFTTSAAAALIDIINPYVLNCTTPFQIWNTLVHVTGGYILQNNASVLNVQAFNFLANTSLLCDGLKTRYEAGTLQNGAVFIDADSVTATFRNISHYEGGISGGGTLLSVTGGGTNGDIVINECKIDIQAGRSYDVGIGGTVTGFTLSSNGNHFVNTALGFRFNGTSYADFAAWVVAGYDIGSVGGGV